MVTIGKVTDHGTGKLAAKGRPRDRASVIAMVCPITCDQCGARFDQLTEETRFVDDLGLN